MKKEQVTSLSVTEVGSIEERASDAETRLQTVGPGLVFSNGFRFFEIGLSATLLPILSFLLPIASPLIKLTLGFVNTAFWCFPAIAVLELRAGTVGRSLFLSAWIHRYKVLATIIGLKSLGAIVNWAMMTYVTSGYFDPTIWKVAVRGVHLITAWGIFSFWTSFHIGSSLQTRTRLFLRSFGSFFLLPIALLRLPRWVRDKRSGTRAESILDPLAGLLVFAILAELLSLGFNLPLGEQFRALRNLGGTSVLYLSGQILRTLIGIAPILLIGPFIVDDLHASLLTQHRQNKLLPENSSDKALE